MQSACRFGTLKREHIYRYNYKKNTARFTKNTPIHIALKLAAWIASIAHDGLFAPGFHDEPLKSNRLGQRPIPFKQFST